jgi:hypothetical protein
MEGARMNGFINAAEREMSLFRKHYEVCVLDRNSVGISLIDRNDELCILYEKSNVQVRYLFPKFSPIITFAKTMIAFPQYKRRKERYTY